MKLKHILACTSPYFGENCANVCQCNNHGSCDPVRGCVCNKQWTGANCEIDVNECAQPNSCPTGYLCENTMGSYKCLCPSGYKEENGQCKGKALFFITYVYDNYFFVILLQIH